MARPKQVTIRVRVYKAGPKAYEANACVGGPIGKRGARVPKRCSVPMRAGSPRLAMKYALEDLLALMGRR